MHDQSIACRDCGTDLPAKVHEAGSFLYDGTSIETSRLGDLIAEGLRDERRRLGRGEAPRTDAQLAADAISRLLDWIAPEHFVAAVRHWGDLGGADGSACDRANAARWCQEPTPGHGGYDDPRPFTCQLPAGHAGAHVFEDDATPAGVAG